jgi:hypothetical protein
MNAAPQNIDERLASIEHELEHLKAGLGLLGITPCSWCGAYYRRSDPGALLKCGDVVCYRCLPSWWEQRCPTLSVGERQKTEMELNRWLVSHHGAEVIGMAEHLPEPERLSLKLVTGCEECNGTGKNYSGKRCHYCDGRGSVWVIVRRSDPQ